MILENFSTKEFQPYIAVDTVPVYWNSEKKKLMAITSERLNEPFKGHMALPGVLLLGSETLEGAAQRALKSKAGISKNLEDFIQVGVSYTENRDPRSKTLSVIYLAPISEEDFMNRPQTINADSLVLSRDSLTGSSEVSLPFDHLDLMLRVYDFLSERQLRDRDFLKGLFPNGISTRTAKSFLESLNVTDPSILSNVHRSLKNTEWLKDSGKTESGSKGKPTTVWSFQ